MKNIKYLIIILLFQSCMEKPIVIGHRGAMGHETENTIASVEKALELGVDMIEIDIFKIKSGELVVFHDEKLDRLANATGNIEEYSYATLTQVVLDGNHKIPMLGEVVKVIDKKVQLNIELKGKGTTDRLNHMINAYVKNDGWKLDDFIISSFEWDELKEMRRRNADIRIAVLTEENPIDAIDFAKEVNAEAINPYFKTLTAENMATLKSAGFKVNTYTVNEPEDILKMQELGVDGIFTNFPERAH